MLLDLRSAYRTLRRRPLLAVMAVLTLALGIGGATAVFTVVNSVILHPLPFPAADRLVRIWEVTPDGARFSASEPTYFDLRAETSSLADVGAYRDLGRTAILTGGGDPERVEVVEATASFMEVLRVQPQVGRLFSADDDRPGGSARALVSDGLWRRRFGAMPSFVGTVIRLDDRSVEVVGIMPPGFDFPRGTDVWLPLGASATSSRDDKDLALVARLADGATPVQANAELQSVAGRIAARRPDSNAGWGVEAVLFHRWVVGPAFRDAAWALAGAVGLLLLLACANVANLLVANASARRTEMRVRGALGAARGQLVRLLFTESALLAFLGTAAGLFVAVWTVDVVRLLGSGYVPRLDELRVDAEVLVFAALAGMASCLVFGLAPALHASRIDLRSGLDEGLRYTSGGRRLRDALVVLEVALALTLLVGAGLLANSFLRLTQVDPGFATDGVLAVPVDLPPGRSAGDGAARFYGDLLERVRAVPGVRAAGATTTNPFRQFGYANNVTPAERAADAPASGLVQAGWRSVTPGYFEAMRIPILAGRVFSAADHGDAERVVVVSETLARQLWPGEAAVGKRIYWGGTTGRTRTVVGVSGDIRDVSLAEDAPPILFLPHAQVDVPSMTLVIATVPGGPDVAPAVREVLRQAAPGLPVPAILEVGESRGEAAAGSRFLLWLLGAFAGIAVMLAAIGVYAMLAFSVAERRRELAVRLVLGAAESRIAGMIMRDGLVLAGAGVLLGTAGALVVTRVLASQLYEVRPTDPLTFGVAIAALLSVAAIACYLPARSAARLAPGDLLRS